jgi:hypothetical protein
VQVRSLLRLTSPIRRMMQRGQGGPDDLSAFSCEVNHAGAISDLNVNRTVWLL